MASRRSLVVSVSLPPFLYEKAVMRARQLGMSFSEYVRYAVRRDLIDANILTPSSPRAPNGNYEERMKKIKENLKDYSPQELIEMYRINKSAIIRAVIRELLREKEPESLALLDNPHYRNSDQDEQKGDEERDIASE